MSVSVVKQSETRSEVTYTVPPLWTTLFLNTLKDYTPMIHAIKLKTEEQGFEKEILDAIVESDLGGFYEYFSDKMFYNFGHHSSWYVIR